MAIHTPTRSIFRPPGGTAQTALKDNRALVEDINRRKLLRGAVSLWRAVVADRLRCERFFDRAIDVARRFRLE